MKKAALHNLGCKVNAYETEAMQQLLENAGYEIVGFNEKADVYVINTCSVTNMADRKSRQMLHKAKKTNPDAVVVAAGCYVQTAVEEVKNDPAVDIIIGNNKKNELVKLLDEYFGTDLDSKMAAKEDVIDINDGKQTFEELVVSTQTEHTRAFIKVQDGCNQFCSYCIIPYARGRVRSRDINNVIKEVVGLSFKGFKEIVLTGIHLSSYGVDNGSSLLELIRQLHKIDGIERIRLGSLEPRLITEDFVKELSSMEKVCPHFHLSLQSGCDETLKRMNRKYTTSEYEEGCNILRKYYEHPAITTDVIVGFPGETEEEFEATKDFLKRIHFYEMHIFKYSKRKGTRAAVMDNQVPEEVKTERSAVLIELGEKMSEEFREYYIGKDIDVLFEEEVTIENEKVFTGYTKEYVKVAAKSDEDVTNRILMGNITKILQKDLYSFGIKQK